MDKDEINDFLYYEFNVSEPTELTAQDRIIAYERLKHKLMQANLTPTRYTNSIVNLADHLEV